MEGRVHPRRKEGRKGRVVRLFELNEASSFQRQRGRMELAMGSEGFSASSRMDVVEQGRSFERSEGRVGRKEGRVSSSRKEGELASFLSPPLPPPF